MSEPMSTELTFKAFCHSPIGYYLRPDQIFHMVYLTIAKEMPTDNS